MTATPTPARRRTRTLTWGALPLVVLGALVTMDHVPGTDISLTVPYAAQGPGPVIDTLGEVDGRPVIEITGADVDETTGGLRMTTVAVRHNMTLAQVIGRWLTSDDTIVPVEQIFPPELSPDEVDLMNRQSFASSEASATVAAMNHLGRPVEIVVAEVMEDSAASGRLEDGDVLLAVEGQDVDKPGQVQELVRAKKPGEDITLTLRRDGHERAETLTLGENPHDPKTAMLGIFMGSRPVDGVEVTYNLQDVGGPSAGMIFSLAVIDKLSPGELTAGRDIAGSGTISEDGTVGSIGGIEHKVRAAEAEGVELFLAPTKNCAAALSGRTGDMVIAKVDTLDDAITAMTDFGAGRDVVTCG